jgi:hypothetical protein
MSSDYIDKLLTGLSECKISNDELTDLMRLTNIIHDYLDHTKECNILLTSMKQRKELLESMMRMRGLIKN